MSEKKMPAGKFHFAIDRGGTFTDIFAKLPSGDVTIMKLLSEDPENYADAPTEGIRRILQKTLGKVISPKEKIDTALLGWVRMGTTVATNALLERKGEPMALAITAGFSNLLHIGNQARPNIFDLEVRCPDVLYDTVIEVDERVVLFQETSQDFKDCPLAEAAAGQKVQVWKKINEEKLRADLKDVVRKGIKSIAVVLMHSYVYPDHERRVGELAYEAGLTHVSLSSQVMPMSKIVPRGFTACADAYLTPHIKKYVSGFSSAFENDLKDAEVLFMQSDGGLTPMDCFTGSRAIVSGPAGGVVGYAMTTDTGTNQPVVGFDMGGTSTDVSRYAGNYEHVFESTTAGVIIQAPQLDINTVAAGGGSKLFFRSGTFVVGPESAGANPGPTCYRKGGPLTVTDANLCLGRLLPQYFPKIFGPSKDQPLGKEDVEEAFKVLTDKVNEFTRSQLGDVGKDKTPAEVAMGFVDVANEAMCRPIRALTQGKGYDTSRHVLACFGGAGGQHACAIARSLGMATVFIHRYAGILSAYGMALADVVHEAQEPCAKVYGKDSFSYIDERIRCLSEQCVATLMEHGFKREQIEVEPYLHMRFERTDFPLMISTSLQSAVSGASSAFGDFRDAYFTRYKRQFGFVLEDRPILVDDIRVRGVGKSDLVDESPVSDAEDPLNPPLQTTTLCYFDGQGFIDTRVHLLENLKYGHRIAGPAIIINQTSTILIEPGCEATITRLGDITIKVGGGSLKAIGTELDSIQLSIFGHRFMSIAEQMGKVLQHTAVSTNIKERLDFSCALFGPDGGLVSNAPHIPVHLGAMQQAVQYQIATIGEQIREGDVILSNHPCAGGTHLPDLTVITPVFYPQVPRPVFFVASRGHHTDIGGITPGSMPPFSKLLSEEGATFRSFKLVNSGVFQEKAVIEMLMAPGDIPGGSGTRMLNDNISDLKAQVAANQKGIELVKELIDGYSLEVVQSYMAHVQWNAETSVRDMMKAIVQNENTTSTLDAEEFMDDGTPIKLRVHIDPQEGTAVFDFSGTGPEVYGNCNAPTAITLSAIIYCLRCMIRHDIPLNQGCLKPIKVIIPKGSLLDPSEVAAVVAGNVLTSQRIVDVIFKAFGACAASQGCMNNVTFGDDTFSYYETVAGGAGAGPRWNGRSGVHTHMTNTRITDPEILEIRYPVVLEQFSLNRGSGGKGKFYGGDGVIRTMLFRRPLTLCVLSERRAMEPYGLQGGLGGRKGLNMLLYANGRRVNLGGKNSVAVGPGDRFTLMSPGGGGFGLNKA